MEQRLVLVGHRGRDPEIHLPSDAIAQDSNVPLNANAEQLCQERC